MEKNMYLEENIINENNNENNDNNNVSVSDENNQQLEAESTSSDNNPTSKDNVIKQTVRRQVSPSGFVEKVVQIKRISKTTKGGRNMRFSALVVIGNKKGEVGFGMGKSIEVPDAIKKALKNANNNIHRVKMNRNGTVYHENIGKHGAGKILVKPAPKGTGIIAGGPVRAVVELAGYHDIYTKCMGSSTPINVIRATIKGLSNQYAPSEISKLREKKIA